MDICPLWVYNPSINHSRSAIANVQFIRHIVEYTFIRTIVRIGNNYRKENCHEIFTIQTISLIIIIEHSFGSLPNTKQGVHSMEINAAEIKQDIHEIIDRITDIETLDFIHKLLLSECR